MDTFLSTLLTMSVTAALVAGIVMLLRLVLRPLPRWITCALWGVVFLRMICPVGLSLPVSLVPQAITSGAYVQIHIKVFRSFGSCRNERKVDICCCCGRKFFFCFLCRFF